MWLFSKVPKHVPLSEEEKQQLLNRSDFVDLSLFSFRHKPFKSFIHLKPLRNYIQLQCQSNSRKRQVQNEANAASKNTGDRSSCQASRNQKES